MPRKSMALDLLEMLDGAESAARLFEVHKRPLPALCQWLDEQDGGKSRADDFKPIIDLLRRCQKQDLGVLEPHQATFARMFMGFAIAAVEICNIEALVKERPQEEIVATLPRVCAAAAMYAVASVCKDNTPFRDIAKMFSEEFRAAAKVSADSLEAQR